MLSNMLKHYKKICGILLFFYFVDLIRYLMIVIQIEIAIYYLSRYANLQLNIGENDKVNK